MKEFSFTLSGGPSKVVILDIPLNAAGASVTIFENGVQAGYVTDNLTHATARFNNGPLYTAVRERGFLNDSYDFKMEKTDGSPFAWGEAYGQHIVFPDNEGSYSMRVSSHRFSKEKYLEHYSFIMNGKVHCEIRFGLVDGSSWFKRNFGGSFPEGIALLSDSLHRDYLLGFMLLFTRNMIAPTRSSSD